MRSGRSRGSSAQVDPGRPARQQIVKWVVDVTELCKQERPRPGRRVELASCTLECA